MRKWWNKSLLIPGLMAMLPQLFAQEAVSDLELIKAESFHTSMYDDYQPKYLFANSKGWLKYNPLTVPFGGFMYLYQRIVSPQLSAGCLFETSCSKFSVNLIREFGIIKGVALSADRLMRCNRVASLDISPLSRNDRTFKVMETVDKFKLKHEH